MGVSPGSPVEGMNSKGVKRLDQQQIAAVVGENALERLHRRRRGGNANFKGNRYELLFGAQRIAELVREWLSTDLDHEVEWQAGGFVDDYVVRHEETCVFRGYQLKNAQFVSWTQGDTSIQEDFALQYKLSSEEGYQAIGLQLVCSNKDTAQALKSSVPQAISAYSTASYYPYQEQIFPMVFECPERWADFAYLSKHERPRKIDVEQVVTVLIGAWEITGPRAKVSDVFRRSRDTSPSIFRSERSDEEAAAQLLPELRHTLAELPDFSFSISRGFLSWSAMSQTTSGVLSFDCFSDKFNAWQKHIVSLHPQSFQDIEGVFV
jgi:hypothetical protein